MNNILEVHNVVKRYSQHTALNDVSINIPKGVIFGLLGPNGAGKTSLIRIINQITGPDEGYVLFDGQKLKPAAHQRNWVFARRAWTLQKNESRRAIALFGSTQRAF